MRRGEHVALAASSRDQRRDVGLVDLAAEPLDHHVDHVGHGLKWRVPDVLGDRGAADDLAGVQHQELEQGELPAT